VPDPISWTHAAPFLISALLFGYLLGSIPFGLVFSRLGGLGDIREVGSGNIGATNVLRTGNKTIAFLTLLGDFLKGTIAVMVAGRYGPDTAVIAGLGAFLGHCFPVWLRFKGGKGVATYIGVLLGFTWQVMLIFAAIWLIAAVLFRYSSFAALLASLATPVALFAFGHIQLAELFLVLTLILWIRHTENIKRLFSGSESKIGKK